MPIYYLFLFSALLLINGILAYCLFPAVLRIVLEGQVFLFVLYVLTALLTKHLRKKFVMHNTGLILAGVMVKMMAALIYLLPFLLGDHQQKVAIALFFMINYIIYLNFSVVTIVRND